MYAGRNHASLLRDGNWKSIVRLRLLSESGCWLSRSTYAEMHRHERRIWATEESKDCILSICRGTQRCCCCCCCIKGVSRQLIRLSILPILNSSVVFGLLIISFFSSCLLVEPDFLTFCWLTGTKMTHHLSSIFPQRMKRMKPGTWNRWINWKVSLLSSYSTPLLPFPRCPLPPLFPCLLLLFYPLQRSQCGQVR